MGKTIDVNERSSCLLLAAEECTRRPGHEQPRCSDSWQRSREHATREADTNCMTVEAMGSMSHDPDVSLVRANVENQEETYLVDNVIRTSLETNCRVGVSRREKRR